MSLLCCDYSSRISLGNRCTHTPFCYFHTPSFCYFHTPRIRLELSGNPVSQLVGEGAEDIEELAENLEELAKNVKGLAEDVKRLAKNVKAKYRECPRI